MFNNIYLILVYKCMNEVDIYLSLIPQHFDLTLFISS